MLQINIDLKKVFCVFLGIAILYAISKAYQMQDKKTESIKKLIPDKDIPFQLSANLQEQIDEVAFKQWQHLNYPTGGTAVANPPFQKPFVAGLSVSIPQTEHLKTNVLSIRVTDGTGNSISHGLNINATTQDVTITFTETETGTVYVS